LTLLVMPTYYRLATLWSERIGAGMRAWTGRARPVDVVAENQFPAKGN
jgi:hypothetical protein